MHLFKSAEHATRASAQRVNLVAPKVATWLACLHMVCRMRLPAALYCLAIRLPCTSQLERAIGPRPCAWACDITDNYRLTSVAQLPSSSRRWRRCTSTDCAGALLAIFWCAHTLRPCTRTLRLKCNNRPALRFTTTMPPHLFCSPACADGCTDADAPRHPALRALTAASLACILAAVLALRLLTASSICSTHTTVWKPPSHSPPSPSPPPPSSPPPSSPPSKPRSRRPCPRHPRPRRRKRPFPSAALSLPSPPLSDASTGDTAMPLK